MATKEPTVDINVEIKALPERDNKILNALAAMRGITKRALIREALSEYASRHRKDLVDMEGALS